MPSDAAPAKKRSAKRYEYQRAARTEIDGEVFEVQIMNLSTSGAQFATRSQIKTKEAIHVLWKDANFGNFGPKLLIVREVFKPESREFKYFYGSRYAELDETTKTNLLKLLRTLRDSDRKVVETIQKITPDYLFGVMDEGPAFLKHALSGGKVPEYFQSTISQIVDYERKAFEANDEISMAIQKMAALNFHCNLLGMMCAQVSETPVYRGPYFKFVKIELERIRETDSLCEQAAAKIQSLEMPPEEKKNLQIRLNETANRLFFNKKNLLQSIMETFANLEIESADNADLYYLAEEYEKLMEYSGFDSSSQVQALYERKTKPAAAEPKIDPLLEASTVEKPKITGFTLFGGFIIFVAVFIFGIYQYLMMREKSDMSQKMDLPIPVKKLSRFDTQLDIVFNSEDFVKLDATKKELLETKVRSFLKQDKTAVSAILMDEKKSVLKVVLKNVPTPAPAPVASESSGPSGEESAQPEAQP